MNIGAMGQGYSGYFSQSGKSSPPAQAAASSAQAANASRDTEKAQAGIAIRPGMEIDLSQFELKQFTLAAMPSPLPAPISSADYEAQLQRQGEVKQTALIKQNNSIIGSISPTGITSFGNSFGQALHSAGLSASSPLSAIESFLNKQYGGDVTLETFAPGQAPSYADVHNSVYQQPYASLVAQQTQSYQQANSDALFPQRLSISV